MISIFERGYLNAFKVTDGKLNEVRMTTKSFSEGRIYSSKTSVFLSHKHSDLEELKGLIGLFSKLYDVDIYIDSMDEKMPKKTSGETAKRIKEVIKKSDRFILLATDDAVESKWCNWELGYGDADKFDNDRIALFPMKERGVLDFQYKGNEYMQIYPFITYYDGSEKYTNGSYVERGYYVCHFNKDGIRVITKLNDWLKS